MPDIRDSIIALADDLEGRQPETEPNAFVIIYFAKSGKTIEMLSNCTKQDQTTMMLGALVGLGAVQAPSDGPPTN